jgi:cyclin-dependent kinase
MVRIMGTPNEGVWPGVSTLPDYKATFPQWSTKELSGIVPVLDESGIDMLRVCVLPLSCFVISLPVKQTLVYDSAKRISGKFFQCLVWLTEYT